MGFGNAKRMDLVKDLMKGEGKKKKLATRKKQKMDRSSSSRSVNSRQSALSYSTNGSSTFGARDPFHAKRVLKVQRFWEEVKQSNDPVAIGEAFLQKVLPGTYTEKQCTVLAETLDSIIYLMSPDMDDDELEESSDVLEHEGIPSIALGDVFADCIDALLDGDLTQKDQDAVNDSVGMLLKERLPSKH